MRMSVQLQIHNKEQREIVNEARKCWLDPKRKTWLSESDFKINPDSCLMSKDKHVLGQWSKSLSFIRNWPGGRVDQKPMSFIYENNVVVAGPVVVMLESARSLTEGQHMSTPKYREEKEKLRVARANANEGLGTIFSKYVEDDGEVGAEK